MDYEIKTDQYGQTVIIKDGKAHYPWPPPMYNEYDPEDIINPDGTCAYYVRGYLHKEDGPASKSMVNDCVISINYFHKGESHRLDGPRRIYYSIIQNKETNILNQFCIHGEPYSESDFYKKISK